LSALVAMFAEPAGSAQPSTQASQAQPVPNPPPIFPPAVQDAIERAAKALEAANPDPTAAAADRQRAQDDLEAQRRMAGSTEDLVVIGWWQFALSIAALILLFFTARYARDAAREAKRAADAGWQAVAEAKRTTEAAEKAATTAAETARLELRAYLSVEPAGINQLIGSDQAMGHVIIRNVGKLPARNVTVSVHMRLSHEGDVDFPLGRDSSTVDRVIQPEAAMKQGSEETPPISEILRPGKMVFVWGSADYEDGYGVRRFTRFCHRYDTGSYNREEDWNRKATTARSAIASDKARYNRVGNDAN